MKKYNLSSIMKRAWDLVKKSGMTISSGLKKAWKEAKTVEKSLEEKVIDQVKSIISEASDIYNYEIKTNLWEKYGKSRTYIKVVETRENSRHYTEYNFGYIDNVGNEYFSGKMDAFGKYTLSGALR